MSETPMLPNGWQPMSSKKIGSSTRNTNEPGGSRLELFLDVPFFDDEQLEKIEQYNDPFIEVSHPSLFTFDASGFLTGSPDPFSGRPFQFIIPHKDGNLDIVGIRENSSFSSFTNLVKLTLPKSIRTIDAGSLGGSGLNKVVFNGQPPTIIGSGSIYTSTDEDFVQVARDSVKGDWGATFSGRPVVFEHVPNPQITTFDFIDISLPSLAATSYSTQLLAQRKWATQGVSRIIAGDSISGTIECPGEVYAYIQGMIGAKGTARIVIPSQGVFSQWRVAILSVDGPSLVDGDRMTGSLVLTVTNTGPNDRDEMKPQFGEISDDFYFTDGVTLSDTEIQPDPDYPIEPDGNIS